MEIVAPRVAARLYSQNGEDGLLREAFADLIQGTFVEIGCIDGRRFSNTLTFEESGWRGLCVEAHGGYIEALRVNRPGSEVVHCAVGDRDHHRVTFYQNSRGSLSTLDRSLEGAYAARFGAYFTGFEPAEVEMRTISSLLDDWGVATPDILSIDVEGTDVQAVRGLDLDRHRPGVAIVEADGEDAERELDAIFARAGYERPFTLSGNRFYFREAHRADRLRAKTFTFEITATQHPLDRNGDTTRTVRVHVPA